MINNTYNIALIGYGYWGPKLARNIKSHSGFNLTHIVETDESLKQSIQRDYPEVSIAGDLREVVNNKKINGVVIATPPKMHASLAKLALENNKHVLVEKPFATSIQDAEQLVQLAEKQKRQLLIDYTFLYNGAVQKIKEEVSKEGFGDIVYLNSTRINLGIFQTDTNVVWDLASHDISILNYLFDELPISVQAIGIKGIDNGIENIAYIHLKYKDKFAHINCSWSSPIKIRQMLIGGSKKAIFFDDIEPTNKIKIFDKGVLLSSVSDKNQVLQDYRTGDIYIPNYSRTEPLYNMIDAFYKSIEENEPSQSSGRKGLDVVKVLCAVEKSIQENNKEVYID